VQGAGTAQGPGFQQSKTVFILTVFYFLTSGEYYFNLEIKLARVRTAMLTIIGSLPAC
jgi:hypothetical protein